MANIMTGYNFDILADTPTLYVSASFLKKASQLGTNEYRIIKEYRKDYPDLVIAKMARKECTASNKTVKYGEMEKYIGFTREATVMLAEFDKVKDMSKLQRSPYKYVKTWFEAQYPNYTEQPVFDADGFVVGGRSVPDEKSDVLEEVEAVPAESTAVLEKVAEVLGQKCEEASFTEEPTAAQEQEAA